MPFPNSCREGLQRLYPLRWVQLYLLQEKETGEKRLGELGELGDAGMPSTLPALERLRQEARQEGCEAEQQVMIVKANHDERAF